MKLNGKISLRRTSHALLAIPLIGASPSCLHGDELVSSICLHNFNALSIDRGFFWTRGRDDFFARPTSDSALTAAVDRPADEANRSPRPLSLMNNYYSFKQQPLRGSAAIVNGVQRDISARHSNHFDNMMGDRDLNAECGPSPLLPVAVEALIERASRRYGVDLRLAKAIAWTESRFDQVRNSPKGARGAMQLMPTTARRFGVTNICDPASNIDGGVRYLRSLIDEFGNPLLAAAAYNAGEQAIYDHHGVPPFRETVTYLVNVLNHQLGLQPPVNVATKRRPATDDDRLPAKNGGVIGTTSSAKFVGGVMQF